MRGSSAWAEGHAGTLRSEAGAMRTELCSAWGCAGSEGHVQRRAHVLKGVYEVNHLACTYARTHAHERTHARDLLRSESLLERIHHHLCAREQAGPRSTFMFFQLSWAWIRAVTTSIPLVCSPTYASFYHNSSNFVKLRLDHILSHHFTFNYGLKPLQTKGCDARNL